MKCTAQVPFGWDFARCGAEATKFFVLLDRFNEPLQDRSTGNVIRCRCDQCGKDPKEAFKYSNYCDILEMSFEEATVLEVLKT